MTKLLMNTWYMGAWSHEVSEIPMSRRLLGAGTMFYRKSDGTVVAMRDRCPHRFAPLSMGKVIEDCIQCPYHGLIFDSSGQCVESPMEEKAPRRVRVQTFPTAERDRIIWFWPGDPDKADTSLLPDYSYQEDASLKHVFGSTIVNCNYEVATDNLMDLTHARTLHTAFGGGLNPSSEYKAGRDGNKVHSCWTSRGVNNAPIFEYGLFPTGGAPVDLWLETHWSPPGAMTLNVATTKTGDLRESGCSLPSTHILSPASEHETVYFWASAIPVETPMDMEQFEAGFKKAFDEEDKPMIEAVAKAMDGETDLLAMKPLLLRADAGAVLARRVLAELIANETTAS